MPLPPKLMYRIVDLHMCDDLQALKVISATCRMLSAHCRKYIFQKISLNSDRPKSYRIGSSSAAEKFARIILQSSDIPEYIQTIHIIYDNNLKSAKPPLLSREAESLCFLLSRAMPKLTYLKISIRADWSGIPTRLREVISATLQSPQLNVLTLGEMKGFPIQILRQLTNLKRLNFRCDYRSAPCPKTPITSISLPRAIVPILHLHNPCSVTLQNVLGEDSPIDISGLHTLSFFGSGKNVSQLGRYFYSCAQSLTCLKLDVGPSTAPAVLPLGSLSSLKHIMLSADIILSTSGMVAPECRPRCQWVIDTLNTCRQPNGIEKISFVLYINFPHLSQRYDWVALDSVFSPQNAWLSLEILDIVICTESGYDCDNLGTAFFEDFLPTTMCNLVKKGVDINGRYNFRVSHGTIALQLRQKSGPSSYASTPALVNFGMLRLTASAPDWPSMSPALISKRDSI
ncbi:hypothetical protein B0H34DRAFT_802657 [Crassisporium funariophilum]|nr:hypothetical protein B0H34DRAFT_802657 [Crassisporium funariophilum]